MEIWDTIDKHIYIYTVGGVTTWEGIWYSGAGVMMTERSTIVAPWVYCIIIKLRRY